MKKRKSHIHITRNEFGMWGLRVMETADQEDFRKALDFVKQLNGPALRFHWWWKLVVYL